jgi:hypothetical protein
LWPIEVNGRAALPRAPLWHNILKTGARAEQQLLNVWTAFALEAMPFVDRNQNRRFDAPAGDNLRTFFQSGVEELAESSLCLLQLPGVHLR